MITNYELMNKLKSIMQTGKALASMNRKGMVGNLNHPIIWVVLGLFGVVIFGGIAVLVLDAFSDSAANDSPAQGIFQSGMDLFANFFAQLGTVGTIAGVLLLLVLLGAVGLWGWQATRGR